MRTSTIIIAGLILVLAASLLYAYWPVSGSITPLQCTMRAGHSVSISEANGGPQVGMIKQLCPAGQRNIGEIPSAASVCCKKAKTTP